MRRCRWPSSPAPRGCRGQPPIASATGLRSFLAEVLASPGSSDAGNVGGADSARATRNGLPVPASAYSIRSTFPCIQFVMNEERTGSTFPPIASGNWVLSRSCEMCWAFTPQADSYFKVLTAHSTGIDRTSEFNQDDLLQTGQPFPTWCTDIPALVYGFMANCGDRSARRWGEPSGGYGRAGELPRRVRCL